MKVLPNRSKYKEESKNMLSKQLVKKLNNGTLKEEHLIVVVDEVFKLGREAGKHY